MTKKKKARAKGAVPKRDRNPRAENKKPIAIEIPADSEINRIDVDLPTPEDFGIADPPKEDPALIAAELMLRRAIENADLVLENVTAKGVVVFVAAPAQAWVPLLRKAWATRLAPDPKRVVSERDRYSRYSDHDTKIFAASEAPSKSLRDEDPFEDWVWRGLNVVGIAADPEWLPKDLLLAADIRLNVDTPEADLLRAVAARFTGEEGLPDLELDLAMVATPNVLRLAARSGQTADSYLRRLNKLVEQGTEKVVRPVEIASPRAKPGLDRLFGMAEAVEWGMNLKEDLDAYRAGTRPWADVDRGALLSGPPGTGKTLFARALAATCGVRLVAASYSTWLANGSGHQGDLLKAMRKSFREAAEQPPSLLFLDEIDSFPDRGRVSGHYPEWHIETVNALLAEIDGVEHREGIILVGACNFPDRLDPALLRSGRLDRHIRIRLPGRDDLVLIFREHLSGDLAHDNLEKVALLAAGSTGADVERFVRGARRRARQAKRAMLTADLMAEVRGDVMGLADLKVAAVHEAGHAVVAHGLGLRFGAVTLRAYGAAGGGVYDCEMPIFPGVDDFRDRLAYLLGGRAAEQVVLGRVSAGSGGGAASDLALATKLAAVTAAEFGMEEERHGLLWLPIPDRPDEFGRLLVKCEPLAELVRERLAEAFKLAVDLVRERRPAILAIADRLLEKSALEPDEVNSLVRSRSFKVLP